MQRILVFFILLFMFLVAGLIAAPLFVDLNGYKNAVLVSIKASTGLEPIINGKVDVTFFPVPTVKVHNITIGNQSEFSKTNIIYIGKVEVVSTFYSLLTGEVNIKEINLVSPVIELEEDSNGNKNWFFLKDIISNNDIPQNYQLPSVINIVNGTISYLHDARRNTIDYIFAKIEIDSKNGPLTISGNFSSSDEVINFNGNIQELVNDAKAKLSLNSKGINLELDGRYKDDDIPKITGVMSGGAPSISKFIKVFFDDTSKIASITSDEKLEIQGMFELSMREAIVKDLSIKSASIKAVANIEATFSHGTAANLHSDVSINIEKMDLDSLYKEKEIKESEIDYYEYTSNNLNLSDFKFNVPNSLSTVLYIKINELNFRGGVISNLVIDADIYDGKSNIREVSATLPGNSDMIVSGSVANNGIRPIFDGSINISGSSLRDVVVWLSDSFEFIPKSELKEYKFATDFVMTSQKINLSNTNLYFDKSLITVEVLIRPASTIPIINIDMNIDGFNCDLYGFTDKLNDIIVTTVNNTPKTDLNQIWFKNFSSIVDFNLNAKDIIYNGHHIDTHVMSLSVTKNLFNLSQFVIDSDITKLNSRLIIYLSDEEKPKIDLVVNSKLFNTSLFDLDSNVEEDHAWKWSDTPFNFLGLKRFVGNAKLTVSDFKHSGYNLSNIIINGNLEDEVFNIKQAHAELNSGKLNIKGQIGINEKNPSIALSLALADINIVPFVKNINNQAITNGSVSLGGNIKSSGISLYQWILNMESKAKFMFKDVLFSGFDLSSIINNSRNTYSVIDMNTIVKNASTTGSTNFDYIYGNLITEKGILKVVNADIKNKQSRGVFVGNMSMDNFDLKGTSKIAFKPEEDKQTHLDIEYSGNISNVKKTINTTNLEQYITGKGAKN